jgi:hypothetical protein
MDKKIPITILALTIILCSTTTILTPTQSNITSNQIIKETNQYSTNSLLKIIENIITAPLSKILPTTPIVNAADPETVKILFTVKGLDPAINNTIAIIDGLSYTQDDFPLEYAWITGSTHRVILTKTIPQGTGRMYNLTNSKWNGLNTTSYYTIPTTDKSLNLNYEYLHRLSIKTVGLVSTYPTTAYLNGVPIGQTSDKNLLNYWLKPNFNGNLSIAQDVTSFISRNYRFTKWKEDNSTQTWKQISMRTPQNITAIYRTQWQVTISPDNEVKGSVEPTGVLPFDPGTTLTIQCTPKEGYFFNGWTTRGQIYLVNRTQSTTNAFINGTGTITANFASNTVQIRIVFFGVSNYTGPILTVDGKSYKYSELIKDNLFTWVAGSTHKVKAVTELPIDNSTRYEFAVWRFAGLPEDIYTVPYANATFGAVYRPLYYLTVNNGGYGTVHGEGWRLLNTRATISIEPTAVSVGTGIQYVFKGWTSSNSKGYIGTNSTANFIFTEPLTETAIWEMEKITPSNTEISLLWLFNIGIVGITALVLASWAISKRGKGL